MTPKSCDTQADSRMTYARAITNSSATKYLRAFSSFASADKEEDLLAHTLFKTLRTHRRVVVGTMKPNQI